MTMTKDDYKEMMIASRRLVPSPYILCLNLILVLIQDCWQIRAFGFAWPTLGLLWIFSRLLREKKIENSTISEMVITLLATRDVLSKLYYWPLDIYYVFFTQGPYSTLRKEFQLIVMLYGPNYDKWANSPEDIDYQSWLLRETNHLTIEQLREIHRLSEEFDNLQETISVNTRTACACGATVMAVNMSQHSMAQNLTESENHTEVVLSGWVTAVAKTTQTNTKLTISDVRLRVNATDGQSNISLFTDMDLLELSRSKDNWIKMAQMNFLLDAQNTIRLGRIAKSTTFNLLDPFKQEPVSYPRIPYGVFAYGFQTENRFSKSHIVADITTSSSYSFVDPKQFREIEGSIRLDFDFRKNLNSGIALQVREQSVVLGLDASYRPINCINLRSMVYTSSECEGLHGMNITGILYPLTSTGNSFDIHSIADLQVDKFKTSLWYSLGVGVRTRDNRWSATLDYEGSSNHRTRDQISIRLIHQF